MGGVVDGAEDQLRRGRKAGASGEPDEGWEEASGEEGGDGVGGVGDVEG